MSDEELVQFKLMLPAGLKDRASELAQANRRSLSQEIVALLEESLGVKTFSDPVDVIGQKLLLSAQLEAVAKIEELMKERGLWPSGGEPRPDQQEMTLSELGQIFDRIVSAETPGEFTSRLKLANGKLKKYGMRIREVPGGNGATTLACESLTPHHMELRRIYNIERNQHLNQNSAEQEKGTKREG